MLMVVERVVCFFVFVGGWFERGWGLVVIVESLRVSGWVMSEKENKISG